MLLLDLSHTSHTRARTGIQRVARSLLAALGENACPVTHDPHLAAWRPLEAWEQQNLEAKSAERKRGARWSLQAKVRARARRWLSPEPTERSASVLPRNDGLIVPEVFSSEIAGA